MDKFDRKEIEKLREELNDVLKSYGMSKNIEFEIGRISYDDNFFRTSLKAFNTANNNDYKKTEFEKNCYKFHINHDWYGKIISSDGIDYKVSAIRTRARKYPIVLEAVKPGQKGIVASVSYVKNRLNQVV